MSKNIARSVLWVILLASSLVAFYPIFLGKFYATGDMRDVTIPIESFYQQQQKLLHIPSWMPDAAFGFPVIAAAQIGFFYPPLLLARFLPMWIYMPAMLILHALAAAIGMYLLSRRLGLSQLAAILSTACVVIGAFSWQHITHFNIWLAIAWLPWQLLAVKSLTSKKTNSWREVGLLTLSLGLPFLIGQLQIPALMAVFTMLYYLMTKSTQIGIRKALGQGLIITLLVAGISAIQILPTLELIQYSSRGSTGDFDIVRANQHSYPLYHLPTILLPRFFGSDNTYWGKRLEIEYGFFIGTIPIFLALGYLWRTLKNKGSSFDSLFFSFAALITFLLSLGSLSPFRLIGLEPSLWVFSAPARYLLFTTLSLGLLAGWGLDSLRQSTWIKHKWLIVIAWLGSLVATIALSYPPVVYWLINTAQTALHLTQAQHIAKISQLLESAKYSSISLFSLYTWLPLIILTCIAYSPKRYLKEIIVSATILELLVIAATTSPTVPWKEIINPPPTLENLPPAVKNGQARLLSIHEGGDTGAYFTDPTSRADAAIRQQQKNLLVPLISSQFHIPGVSWPASLDIQAVTEAVSELDLQNVAQVAELNIGVVTSPYTNIGGREKSITNITLLPIMPKSRVAVLDPVTHIETAVTYTRPTPDTILSQVDIKNPSTFIVRDTWYPGWDAFVDNKNVPIEKTGPHNIFRAIQVPTGQHMIEMRYEPGPLAGGIAISICAVLLSCAILLIGYKISV